MTHCMVVLSASVVTCHPRMSARLDGAISEELFVGTVPSERQLCLVKSAGKVGRVSVI